MSLMAGIDIGNDTTEIALVKVHKDKTQFMSSEIVKTTGIKGTRKNIHGVFSVIKKALDKVELKIEDLDLVRINEAAPVIGDVAMETITETIITESTMIGHNPSTPGGVGLGVGYTIDISKPNDTFEDKPLIVIIPKEVDFVESAKLINQALEKGKDIRGAIVQNDDGVLINNRLIKTIPIVDEVKLIDKVHKNVVAGVEVALTGDVVEILSNPFGIATEFDLSPEETKLIVPIARALIGNRSAVVIKTPKGDIKERKIPSGEINIIGEKRKKTIDVDEGAFTIMNTLEKCIPIEDIKGEPGTNAGGMLEKVRQVMSNLTGQHPNSIKIQDLLAVDTFVPQIVKGGLAGEFSMENAVGIAAMVKADKLQMQMIADELQDKIGVKVEVGGIEADMAIRGVLTTPGSSTPLAILDMGAGSTDASFIKSEDEIVSIHLAGAGNMVTMLINSELGLENIELSEEIKRYPLAKVESLFHIRHEDGSVEFFEDRLDPQVFARVVVLKEGEMIPIPIDDSIEKIRMIRQSAKKKIFVTNAIRALKMVCPTENIRDIDYVVLLGGSSLDFEIPQLVTNELAQYGVVAGRANIRGVEGPRNAVATGLILSHEEVRGKYGY